MSALRATLVCLSHRLRAQSGERSEPLLATLRGEGRDGAVGQRVFSGGSRALKGVEVLVRMLRSAP